MKNENLDNTMPLDELNDKNLTRSDKYNEVPSEEISREEKNSDMYDDLEGTKEIKNIGDLVEEGKPLVDVDLDERIEAAAIAVSEEIKEQEVKEAEEKAVDEQITKLKNDEDDDDEELFAGLKAKLAAMPKKKKIMIFGGIALVFILLVVLLVAILVKATVPKEKVDEPIIPVEDVETVIVDNFYYKDGRLYFLDNEENELGNYECENKDEDKCYVAINANNDELNVPEKYDPDGAVLQERIPIYLDEYVFVYDSKNDKNKVINLYSFKENKVVQTYDTVKAYKDDLLIVSVDGKYGLIEFDNGLVELIAPTFKELYFISGMNNLVAKNLGGYVVVDKSGTEISTHVDGSYDLKYYNDKFIVVRENKTYNVYNYQGEELVHGYDFATVVDDYMVLVEDKEVFIRDGNKVKYNEEGYALKNTTYVKKYNYDKDGKLVGKEVSFELLKEDNKLQLLVYDGEEPKYYGINGIEAYANKKYPYVSYFNKKLYFYDDTGKENVIGSYKCNNENSIQNADSYFNSCYIASDTIYEKNDMEVPAMINRKSLIPIINTRFVFIKDGSDIILYDLKDEKKLGTYTSVNTYTPHNDYANTLKDGDTYVVALNKKGKYALLRVGASSVDAVVSFEYTNMEKVGDYLTAQKSSSEWKLFKVGDGTPLATLPGRLMGYSSDKKYIKYLDGTDYVVSNFTGKKVSEDKYDYVELYVGFYVGIKNKKLNIYDYEGKKITKEDLTIDNNKYSRVDNPAFKVVKNEKTYVVSVYDGSKYVDNVYKLKNDSYKDEVVEDETSGEENKEETSTESNQSGSE